MDIWDEIVCAILLVVQIWMEGGICWGVISLFLLMWCEFGW